MKTLTLSLNKEWFNMIKSGEKKEEYREIKPFWKKRLDYPRGYDKLVFTLGYPKSDDTERRMIFRNPKIRTGTGNPGWGAEPGKLYFIITWEE